MSNPQEFVPQWTSPPGDTMAHLMVDRQISRDDLARQLDVPLSVVEGLLDGREAITLGLARQLAEHLGGSPAFWMTRDRQYRDDVVRLREAGLPWLHELPLLDMERLGWIPVDPAPGFEVEAVLRYFAVPSVSAWRARYAAVMQGAAYRTSPSFESTPGALAAWLRQGERLADEIACAPWNAEALRCILPDLRDLTRLRDPSAFLPTLKAMTARCGVAVVVLQAPSRCRASGAAQWLSDDKALVLLSARHLTDDHFWFTLFHEIGHLLLHSETRLFLDEDGDTRSTLMEDEANAFAEDVLIPPHHRDALARVRPETFAVVRLAKAVGITPGVIVAQLQRMGRVPKNHLNRLKRRFDWSNGQLVSRENA